MFDMNVVGQVFHALPSICDALLKCDDLMRDHEERQAMKYSDQEYLKSVHRLYKSGRINSEQAQRAINLIFANNNTVEAAKLKLIDQEVLDMFR